MGFTFRYGGKEGKSYELQPSKDTIVVGTQNNHLATHIPLSPRARGALDRLVPVMDVSPVGIQLFAARHREPLAWVHRARALLPGAAAASATHSDRRAAPARRAPSTLARQA